MCSKQELHQQHPIFFVKRRSFGQASDMYVTSPDLQMGWESGVSQTTRSWVVYTTVSRALYTTCLQQAGV